MSDNDVVGKHSGSLRAKLLEILNNLIFPLKQKWFWGLFLVFTGTVIGILLLVFLFFVLPGFFKLVELMLVGIFYVVVSTYVKKRGKHKKG